MLHHSTNLNLRAVSAKRPILWKTQTTGIQLNDVVHAKVAQTLLRDRFSSVIHFLNNEKLSS